jgi:hypothetical protein
MPKNICFLNLFKDASSLFNNCLVFCISEIWFNDRNHSRLTNEFRILLTVKTGVKGYGNSFERYPQSLCGHNQFLKRVRKQNSVMNVYSRCNAWDKNIPRIVFNINRFFPSLMLMSRVTYLFAPFLATTFEPSPWSALRSSFSSLTSHSRDPLNIFS